jgi:hypothetical protein
MENMDYIVTVATPMKEWAVDGTVKMIKEDIQSHPTFHALLQHAVEKICEKSIVYATVLNGAPTSCVFVFNRHDTIDFSLYLMNTKPLITIYIRGRNITDRVKKCFSKWKQRLRLRQLCSWIVILRFFKNRDICRTVFRLLYGQMRPTFETPNANPYHQRRMFGYTDTDGVQLSATIDGTPEAEKFWSSFFDSPIASETM